MSDQDSKDTQERNEDQNEGTKTRKDSQDENVKSDQETERKGHKEEETKTKEASESKQNTEQDTQTDNTDKKDSKRKDSQTDNTDKRDSNRKDSQTDTDTPVDTKGTEAGQEGRMESLPNGSDSKTVSVAGSSHDVSKQVEQTIGDSGDQTAEKSEEGNLVGKDDNATGNGQQKSESEQDLTEMEQKDNQIPEVSNSQQSHGNEDNVSHDGEKTEKSVTLADTGQAVVEGKDVSQTAEKEDNKTKEEDDESDDEEEEDDDESGEDESGSEESENDDSENEQTQTDQVVQSETSQAHDNDRNTTQAEQTQENAVKIEDENNVKLEGGSDSQSREIINDNQSVEANNGGGGWKSQQSDNVDNENDRSPSVHEERVQTRDRDQLEGKVGTKDESSDQVQDREETKTSDIVESHQMVDNVEQKESMEGEIPLTKSEGRSSPTDSNTGRAENTVGHSEEQKSLEQVEGIDEKGRGTPSDSITDKNREVEFEGSSLTQSEHDETSMGGHPPISTVYVKPPRKQPDSESQVSDTAHSQDEIEIVSKANKEAEDERQEQETTQEVGESQAEVQNKEEAGEVQKEDEEVQKKEEEVDNVVKNEKVEQETKQEDMVKEDQNDKGEVIEDQEQDRVRDIGKNEVQDRDEGNLGVKEGEENAEGDVSETGEIKVEENEQVEGEKMVKEESESEEDDEDDDDDDDDDDDEDDDEESDEEEESKEEEKKEDKKDINPESVSGLKDGGATTAEQTHVDVQRSNEKAEDKVVAQTEEKEKEREENEKTGDGKTTVSEKPPTTVSEVEQSDEKQSEKDTRNDTKDESKASVAQEDDRQSVKSAQSRGRISTVSTEKRQEPEVSEEAVDSAQAPVTPPPKEPSVTAKENDDDRGSIQEEEEKYVKSRSSSSSDSSDSRETDSKSSEKLASQTSVKTENVETEETNSRKDSKISVEYESAKQEECKEQPVEPKQSKPGSRGRANFKSPRKSSGSPTRRSQRRDETRSARRSPRDKTRSPSRPRTTNTMRSFRSKESDGRARQKEFFKEELKRLEESLKRERSKIHRPEVKKHTPYIFNSLEPYYNTSTVRYLLELPDEVEHQFISRKTAIGLCDPWVDYNMDTQFLPRLTGSSRAINRQQELDRRDQKIRDRERRSKKEGSTMLPKFPVVTMDSKDLANKKLNYSDVPVLREELRQKYSQNATKKIDQDYQRTKQDFYRMDLDKLDEVHPINRPHMRNAYFAYLQNTPGSKKAINECVKGMKSEGKAH